MAGNEIYKSQDKGNLTVYYFKDGAAERTAKNFKDCKVIITDTFTAIRSQMNGEDLLIIPTGWLVYIEKTK